MIRSKWFTVYRGRVNGDRWRIHTIRTVSRSVRRLITRSYETRLSKVYTHTRCFPSAFPHLRGINWRVPRGTSSPWLKIFGQFAPLISSHQQKLYLIEIVWLMSRIGQCWWRSGGRTRLWTVIRDYWTVPCCPSAGFTFHGSTTDERPLRISCGCHIDETKFARHSLFVSREIWIV